MFKRSSLFLPDDVMKLSTRLQKVLFKEFKSRRKQTYQTLPVKSKQYYYYSNFEKGKDHQIICRKKDSLSAKEQIVLDVNKLAESYGYTDISGTEVSPDQHLLYYGIDTKGNHLNDFSFLQLDGVVM